MIQLHSDCLVFKSETGQAIPCSAELVTFELVFFPRLRDELRKSLQESPGVVRFQGLRSCVKQLVGAHRWSPRCQKLSDQIVAFLRLCWSSEVATAGCALVVR